MDIIANLRMGNQHHQAGRLMEAQAVYEEILRHSPNHTDALHLSGLVAYQQGDSQNAVRRIEQAALQNPTHVGYLKNLCVVLVAIGPLEKAVETIEKTLALCPDASQLWFELGNTRQKQGKLDRAVKAYQTLLRLDPDHAEAHHNLGIALYGQGLYDQAVACYEKAIELKSDFPEALYNMANALREIGRIDKAIYAMEKALSIKSDYFEAQFNLAKMYKETGQTEAAIEAYTTTLQINPASDETYNNLGNLFYDLGQAKRALEFYNMALTLNPGHADAHVNMSLALQETGDLKGAMASAERALKFSPGKAEAVSTLAHQKRQACDWQDIDKLDDLLDDVTHKALSNGRKPAEGPFLNLSRRADPAMNLAVAEAWSKELASRVKGVLAVNGKKPQTMSHCRHADGKITIGYLSNNFRNHPMAHLLCGVFGLHDRQRFKIHCYSYGKDDGSPYREQIKKESDRFVELVQIHDQDAAALIHGDKVDILIDLTGYMKDHRMGICALRPAPIQVRYLGQAGSTGADFFDYLIADATAIPESQQAYYSEKLVYLPHCYQINNRQQPVADDVYLRRDFGLPSKGLVFCSFASHYKLDPVMFASWMNILSAVEESVLWLIPGSEIAEQNLRTEAVRCGIAPERIIFAGRLPKAQHLARLHLADLALDTRIVGGAATTSDALWAGVPVITLAGDHFASRMSASLLNAVGLPELVYHSMADYASAAVMLAQDHTARIALREKLAGNKMTMPLFDTERSVRCLESAYARMWETHTLGYPPQPFTAGVAPEEAPATAYGL